MNVLVVAPHLPPTHIGGVEVYAKSVADQLVAFGHQVEAAAVETLRTGVSDACDAATDIGNGYPVHRLTLTLRRGHPFSLVWRHDAAEDWLAEAIERFAPDVVHLHSGYLLGGAALAAARRCSVPSVVTLHDYWFACPRITLLHPDGAICSGPDGISKCAWCLVSDRRRYSLMNRTLGKRLTQALAPTNRGAEIAGRQAGLLDALHHAAVVLAPTRFVAERVSSIGFPLGRIRLSPCGHRSIPRGSRAKPAGGLRLGYMGQIAPHKGVELAIEAVRANTDPRLSLAVYGPLTTHAAYATRLQQVAAGDPRITFRGAYERGDLSEILSGIDALIVPSTWYEVAAIIIQEAHGAGVPVIGSRIGGTPELVTHERDGLLFEPGSAGDLARQIERLQTEDGLLARLSEGSRSPRTIEDDVEALVGVYASVCGRA